jgi:putative ABC transport system permease protein
MSGPGRPVAPGPQWRQTVVLAWQDMIHEWRVSLCLIFALAAVLAPLLVLFGLKSGIVGTMRERLQADPVNRGLTIRGHYHLNCAWFAETAARADVGFLVPRTRVLAATITLRVAGDQTLQDVDMIPTATGDPLLPPGTREPRHLRQILLSHTAAGKLSLHPGDTLEGLLDRRLKGTPQGVRIPLMIADVLPETALAEDAVFVPLALLIAAEDYRDGFAVPELGVAEGDEPRSGDRSFASARIYARDLDDVAPLAEHLRSQGVEVVTRARDIETVKAIDRVLSLIFVVLAAIGVAGYLLSLAASLWANVDRKRREIALLRLVGLRTGPVVGFPAVQALIVAVAGILLSATLYAGVSTLFNRAFATELRRDEFVCRLLPGDAAAAVALTLVFALSASAVGGYRATRIDPAESLRDP